jgi:hypothetical protein
MHHSVGLSKAWRKKFLRAALSALPPTNGEKHFIECVSGGPLHPYTPWQVQSMKIRAGIAAFIGRFYRRL